MFAQNPVLVSVRTVSDIRMAEIYQHRGPLCGVSKKGVTLLTDLDRFMGKVDQSGMHRMGMALNCWDWSGCIDDCGCPRFRFDGKCRRAKRALFEILIGENLPADVCVKSICGNKLCLRPEHLFPCNEIDAAALGQWGHINSGSTEYLRDLNQKGYEAAEIAFTQGVSVPLIETILREGIG